MPFLWLAVPDRADGGSDRGYLESNSIALLSCLTGGLNRPSAGWLGHYANNRKIRRSGLWNSNHVEDSYDPGFLEALANLVKHTG
jgi:hypothetical protein